MIELEFIDSPDRDVLGKRVVYFDDFSLGRGGGNAIIVDDPALKIRDIRFSVVERGVWVENGESDYYLVNGKKISGKKIHTSEARIQAGNTVFTIVSFKRTNPKGESYDAIYQRDIQPEPYKDQLFHAIKREMDKLETN